MNDLFSGSFSRFRSEEQSPRRDDHVIEMGSTAGSGAAGVNLDKFFADVESVKDELKELERVYFSLQSSHEKSKTLHNATAVKDLRSRMDADVTLALKKAKVLKVRLEALDRSNAANRSLPNCGPGSSSDRTRISVVNGLRKKLKDSMDSFNALRQKISSEYRETVQRRYYTVSGENPDEKTLDLLISTGESETFLQKAIQEQGRGQVLDTIQEIQERHDAVKDMERNLQELHQVFLDMAVLVQAQGEQIDDIENHVMRANSFVSRGTQQLTKARASQKNTRKWTCYAIILLLVIILIVILSLKPWNWGNGGDNNNNSNSNNPPPAASFSEASPDHHVIEMAATSNELNKFFQDVESVQNELNELQKINKSLQSAHEQSKSLHNSKAVKDLQTRMDADVHTALKNAKVLKVQLDALDKSNAANRSLPGCGPGSSSDRTRTSVVNGLRKKLKDSMDSFNDLRNKISSEHRETVQRRYFTVTGENPDDKTLDLLISTGESETFLQKAIQEQGRGGVLDTIQEIQERHDGVKAMERNLNELHQVFMDMAVLVQAQGEQLDDIQGHVERANSYVHSGTQQLQKARFLQKNTRKWTCYGIIILLSALGMATVRMIGKYLFQNPFFLQQFILLTRRFPLIPNTDIAVNFTDGMFRGIYNGKQCHVSDIATVLSRAWTAGVDRIIVTGGSLEESKEALTIAETDGFFRLLCFVTVTQGFFVLLVCTPLDARSALFSFSLLIFIRGRESGDPDKHFQALLSLAKEGIEKGKVVAIGECGLDYDRLQFCPAEIQKKYFEKQFELAHTTKLPMFLHMRAAAPDFCEIVERNNGRCKWLLSEDN
ncbi:hypothetical protein DVH24_019296 [Malus domestica]|uniref:t-SNARE coiled-coil homology domain-containing protein n=2 Tax=Malus domestica TaxID=3750 RepID=A0A498HXP9_MALDO|nr:hypothetical protein DVH24_019296 [Malus domestica]